MTRDEGPFPAHDYTGPRKRSSSPVLIPGLPKRMSPSLSKGRDTTQPIKSFTQQIFIEGLPCPRQGQVSKHRPDTHLRRLRTSVPSAFHAMSLSQCSTPVSETPGRYTAGLERRSRNLRIHSIWNFKVKNYGRAVNKYYVANQLCSEAVVAGCELQNVKK